MTAEADGASSGSSGPGGPSPSAGRSPASGRRLQEVQIIQIVEGPTLIQPSEVKVSQGVVLSAEPVLTPIGKTLLCITSKCYGVNKNELRIFKYCVKIVWYVLCNISSMIIQ